MVYDADENCFYTTAITEKDFILVKISAETPSIEPMSLPAGIRKDTNIQYTNIYRSDAGGVNYMHCSYRPVTTGRRRWI